MAFTYGFYNSMDGDRRYDAEQLSQIFDGIIADGVYQSIGDAFVVKAASGLGVTVGTGRAWFNGTWSLNDTIFPLALPKSDVILDRIDAIVIEVNKNVSKRMNEIKVIEGTPASNPKRPKPIRGIDKFQYPLAYIYRKAGSKDVSDSNISNAVGTAETPFVIGVIKSMSIDFIVEQWESQWTDWLQQKKNDGDVLMDKWYEESTEYYQKWTVGKQGEFEEWFDDIKELLATNDKGELAGKIKALQDKLDSLDECGYILHAIIDSASADLQDSAGRPIQGQTVYKKL